MTLPNRRYVSGGKPRRTAQAKSEEPETTETKNHPEHLRPDRQVNIISVDDRPDTAPVSGECSQVVHRNLPPRQVYSRLSPFGEVTATCYSTDTEGI
jgi:hypothetical protein